MSIFLRISLILLIFSGKPAYTQTCNMSGIYKIGPGGNYNTISAAYNALKLNGMGGSVILELKSNYTSAAEGSIRFSGIPCISDTRTLTMRPEAGAQNLQIRNSYNSFVISLSNARYVTIDGRAGGIGNTIDLTIANFSSNGYVFDFSYDASFNTLKYLNINGATSSQTSGLVNFLGSTFTITNGNNDNLITNCNFGSTIETPANCIYAAGSAGKKNVRNRITNCNIKDYAVSVSGAITCGILLDLNNAYWEISGNSFYQTQPRNAPGTKTIAIYINDTSSGGFKVNNNFIGGNAPNCGGSPLIYTGGFQGIAISAGTSEYSDIQGNTIQNINWREYIDADYFCGISLSNGTLHCGNTIANTIGSSVKYASITATASLYSTPLVAGILAGNSNGGDHFDTVLIKNNIISGIKGIPDPGSTYMEVKLYGIYIQRQSSGYMDVSDNMIGSNTMLNSLDNTSQDGNGPVKGICAESNGSGAFDCRDKIRNSICGNTISNLRGVIVGIEISGGRTLIKKNIIQKLKSSTGISSVYNCPGTIIAENTIRNFTGSCTGIYSSLSCGLTIEGNFIHTFQGPVLYSTITGIHIYPTAIYPPPGFLHGSYIIRNNIIRFGIDSSGLALTQHFAMCGMDVPLDSTLIIHNSIFIGGTETFSIQTSGIYINSLRSAGNRVTNNILMNQHATAQNAFGPSSLINFKDDIVSLAGLTLNNNLYFGPSECFTAIFKGNRFRGLGQWRTTSGMDGNSIFANPNFINQMGDINNANLHLASPTPAESNGIAESDAAFDFDMENRSGLSPVDIGADAGNYVKTDISNAPFAVLCPGGNAILTTDVIRTFAIYQWQINSGFGFTDISDNSYYSGTASPNLALTGIPSAWYGYKYRGLVNTFPGTAYSLKFENKWTGAISNAWENPANWSCGVLPNVDTDIIIGNGMVVLSSNTTCRTLMVKPGANFTVAPGATLTIMH